MQYLASTDAQRKWVQTSGALSANRQVPTSDYPDVLSKNAADILKNAEIVVFDASDMMPGQMNTAFFNAVMSYVENPGSLDKILQDLERVRGEAYKQ